MTRRYEYRKMNLGRASTPGRKKLSERQGCTAWLESEATVLGQRYHYSVSRDDEDYLEAWGAGRNEEDACEKALAALAKVEPREKCLCGDRNQMINHRDFVLLAGKPDTWDQETLSRRRSGEDLVAIQRDQHGRGRLSAVLAKGESGWYVRAGSSLVQPDIFANTQKHGGPLDGSKRAAVEWGKQWASEDPERREFYANRKDYREQPTNRAA